VESTAREGTAQRVLQVERGVGRDKVSDLSDVDQAALVSQRRIK
jgi:hypothetical protein